MNRQRRPSFARRLFGSASWWRRSRQRPQLRPNSIGSPQVAASSYPGHLVPQRHRRCLRVPILELAFTPEATLDRPPPFPEPLGGWQCEALGVPTAWELRGSTLRMRRSRAWLEVAVCRAAPLLERNVTGRFPISQPLVRALPRESDGPPELLLGDRNSRPHSLCGSLDLG